MKNILILGATGSLAQVVIPILLKNNNLKLTLVARNIKHLTNAVNERINIISADVTSLEQLESIMQGQDIVYANLAGELVHMAKNIVSAMDKLKIKRLIWISSMGIYNETGNYHGAILQPYCDSAEIIEHSNLDYTIIRPAWFTNDSQIDYTLTSKGQQFIGQQVSRRSIAALIVKLLERPDYAIRESLGIAKV